MPTQVGDRLPGLGIVAGAGAIALTFAIAQSPSQAAPNSAKDTQKSNNASTLGVSIKTIQAYCARIKEKLKLSNAAELLRAAVEWDLRGGA